MVLLHHVTVSGIGFALNSIATFFQIGITCVSLGSINNGQISYDSFTLGYGTTATYSCDTGFGLSGRDRERVCGGNGSSPSGLWNGNAPHCEGS